VPGTIGARSSSTLLEAPAPTDKKRAPTDEMLARLYAAILAQGPGPGLGPGGGRRAGPGPERAPTAPPPLMCASPRSAPGPCERRLWPRRRVPWSTIVNGCP
jgi:hypothetical protein